MQRGGEKESCLVLQAEKPPQGNCKSVLQALVMANNVRERDVSYHEVGVHRRASGSQRRA